MELAENVIQNLHDESTAGAFRPQKTARTSGRFADFMADPVEFMRHRVAEGAEVQRLRLGPKHFIFAFSPEAAQDILVRRAHIYVQNRTIFDRIRPVTGSKGLVQLEGKPSQAARAKSRPIFTPPNLEQARAIIGHYTGELLEAIGDKGAVDVTESMTELILRTALKIFLGVDSKELVTAIGLKFLRLNHLCGLRMRALLPVPLVVPTGKNREIRSLQREIRALLERHVRNAAHGQTQTVPGVFQDDSALIDHCMTFLFAGHETTAASLAFSLLLLARYPRYQDAIAAGDMATTLAVYKESLRLYPPAYMLAREAAADDVLTGVPVRKGDQVIIGLSAMMRNERYYENPGEFRPERFFAKQKQPLDAKQKHPFAFIPFGAGQKSCIGEKLAYMEATTILSLICGRYRLSAGGAPILAEPLITLHPVAEQMVQFTSRKEARHGSSG